MNVQKYIVIAPYCFSAFSDNPRWPPDAIFLENWQIVVYWNSFRTISLIMRCPIALKFLGNFESGSLLQPPIVFDALSDIQDGRQQGWKFVVFGKLQFLGNNSWMPWLIALKVLGNIGNDYWHLFGGFSPMFEIQDGRRWPSGLKKNIWSRFFNAVNLIWAISSFKFSQHVGQIRKK